MLYKLLHKIFYGIPFHLRLLLNWSFLNQNNVSFNEILYYIAWALKGKAYKEMNEAIISIEEKDELYRVIHLKSIKDPLYYPKQHRLNSLEQTIRESFGSIDWHRYEKMETFVEPEDVVLDCGAAEGLFSLMVKDRCKNVYVVEPEPIFIKALEKTFELSTNITLVKKGLGEYAEKVYLHNDDIASYIDNNPENGVPIEVVTIDELFYEKKIPVNFIKADIEGFELQMLRGAIKTIKQNRPKIAVTTYHNKDDFENIRNFLHSLNLDYVISEKGIVLSGAPVMLHAYPKK